MHYKKLGFLAASFAGAVMSVAENVLAQGLGRWRDLLVTRGINRDHRGKVQEDELGGVAAGPCLVR